MSASDILFVVLELLASGILLWSMRLLYNRYKRTGDGKDKLLFIGSIIGFIVYVPLTIVSLLELQLTGLPLFLQNLGIYAFILIEFSLLAYAYYMAERNEINLEVLVDEKSKELVAHTINEREAIDKLRRQHAQELITGARRLSEQIRDGIEKPLKDSLNLVFLLKQNPDLMETYADSLEEYLEKITSSVKEIEEKTSVGELKIGFEDLSELVQKAIDAVDPSEGIKVEYNPVFHAAAIDPVKMFLVMENIIENAVEAMGSTGVLGVSIELVDDMLNISISDTGKGIDDKDQGKVFTPFFTRKENGLGLGLVYCMDVVKAHGGNITFDSSKGGTTFIVSLPKSSSYKL